MGYDRLAGTISNTSTSAGRTMRKSLSSVTTDAIAKRSARATVQASLASSGKSA